MVHIDGTVVPEVQSLILVSWLFILINHLAEGYAIWCVSSEIPPGHLTSTAKCSWSLCSTPARTEVLSTPCSSQLGNFCGLRSFYQPQSKNLLCESRLATPKPRRLQRFCWSAKDKSFVVSLEKSFPQLPPCVMGSLLTAGPQPYPCHILSSIELCWKWEYTRLTIQHPIHSSHSTSNKHVKFNYVQNQTLNLPSQTCTSSSFFHFKSMTTLLSSWSGPKPWNYHWFLFL